MPNKATLEQVEQLAAQLSPPERLKLVARICEELNDTQTAESVGCVTGLSQSEWRLAYPWKT